MKFDNKKLTEAFYGHAGRPGKVGGSAPKGSGGGGGVVHKGVSSLKSALKKEMPGAKLTFSKDTRYKNRHSITGKEKELFKVRDYVSKNKKVLGVVDSKMWYGMGGSPSVIVDFNEIID